MTRGPHISPCWICGPRKLQPLRMRPSCHHLTCCAPLLAALVDLNERALALRTGGMRDEEDGASGPYGEPGMGGGRVCPPSP